MEAVDQALKDVKKVYQQVLGQPAPDLDEDSFVPFPPGFDPTRLAVWEAQQLRGLADQWADHRERTPRPGTWLPPADCFLTQDQYVIQVEIPGVSREDVKVYVKDGACVVEGERKPPVKVTQTMPLSIERPWGAFERRFVLPVGSEPEGIKARHLDGVLELRIPLVSPEKTNGTKIDVT